MCLGASARAANETARRNHQYQLDKREADWMQTVSLTGLERVQYKQGINASNLGLSQVFGEIESTFGNQIGETLQADESNWKKFLEKSPSSSLQASGRTGRSIDRISTADLGNYLREGSRNAYALTRSREKLDAAGAQAVAKARAEQMNLFARNNIIKNPDLAPPEPVYQNVAQASLMDGLKIAGAVAGIATGVGAIGTASAFKAFLASQAASQVNP